MKNFTFEIVVDMTKQRVVRTDAGYFGEIARSLVVEFQSMKRFPFDRLTSSRYFAKRVEESMMRKNNGDKTKGQEESLTNALCKTYKIYQ